MLASVKISSKRQITIPTKLFKALQLKEGDNLAIKIEDASLVIKKAQNALDELVGSVEIPDKYKGKSIDFIINESKKEYFAKNP